MLKGQHGCAKLKRGWHKPHVPDVQPAHLHFEPVPVKGADNVAHELVCAGVRRGRAKPVVLMQRVGHKHNAVKPLQHGEVSAAWLVRQKWQVAVGPVAV